MDITLFLFGVFVILQALDFYSTTLALKKQNNYEANPVMRFFMDKLGVELAMLILKAVAILLIWHFLSVIPIPALAVIDLVYIYVVYRNFKLS